MAENIYSTNVEQNQSPPAKEKSAAAKEAINLALETGAKFWHTPDGEAWVSVPRDGHIEHYTLRGKEFRNWLAGLYYTEKKGKPLYTQALQDALTTLEHKALFNGEEREVYTRLAECEGKIYLDLARPDWNMVEITSSGWQIVPAKEAPVRFRRGRHQKPLPVPEQGGSLAPFIDLLPLRERRDLALVLGWLIGTLSPQGPYPILVLSGEKGAGKSTIARMLKAIVDPQKANLRAEPGDVDTLMVGARASWILAYDNLSKIPIWLSDALCRLSTGGGLGKRELYTDSDEHMVEAQRPVILTGISFGVLRDDLGDRVALVNLTRLEDKKRLPERELWESFDKAHPHVLGALLDAVVMALERWEHVRKSLPSLPRLADWAIWAEAAAPGLGLEAREVIKSFYAVQAELNQDLLDNDPVAAAFILLTKDWQDGRLATFTSSELLSTLEEVIGLKEAKVKPNGWLRTPASLARHIPRIKAALKEVGIRVDSVRDSHNKRFLWIVEKVLEKCSELSPAEHPHTLNRSSSTFAEDAGDAGENFPF